MVTVPLLLLLLLLLLRIESGRFGGTFVVQVSVYSPDKRSAPFGESEDVDEIELYAKMFRSTSDTAVLDIFNPSKTVIVQTANNNNDLTLDKVFVIDTEKDEVTPILEKLEIPVRRSCCRS